jgi:hypothetical protein
MQLNSKTAQKAFCKFFHGLKRVILKSVEGRYDGTGVNCISNPKKTTKKTKGLDAEHIKN